MFAFLKPKKVEPSLLEQAKESAYNQLESHDADSDSYRAVLDNIIKLEELDSPKKERKPIDPNVVITALAAVATPLMIVGLETGLQTVLSRQALSFASKVQLPNR